jgi:hypothetical protein
VSQNSLAPMVLHRLTPSWANGNNPYGWVDSADRLFGPPELRSTHRLADSWAIPVLHRDRQMPGADAFCSPGGFFIFSRVARTVLSDAIGTCAEWLPVILTGHDDFSLLHPVQSRHLGPRAKFEANPVSKNITQIDEFEFSPAEVGDCNLFYVAQPLTSAAGSAGHTLFDIVTRAGKRS